MLFLLKKENQLNVGFRFKKFLPLTTLYIVFVYDNKFLNIKELLILILFEILILRVELKNFKYFL